MEILFHFKALWKVPYTYIKNQFDEPWVSMKQSMMENEIEGGKDGR